jgi:hypothetical protein
MEFKLKKKRMVSFRIQSDIFMIHFLEIIRDLDKKDLLDWIQSELGITKVSEIKPIFEQSEHPFIITAQNHSAMRHILRYSFFLTHKNYIFI